MRPASAVLLYGIFVLVLLFSCAGSPPSPAPAPPPAPSAEKPPESPEAVRSESLPVPIKTEDQSSEISHEEYSKTFEEVEIVIAELNGIIQAGDYEKWLTYLSPQFIREVMDPRNIERINEQPILKRNNIVLRTLGDYFMYVVGPSRTNVRLDDLVFTDANRVRAFMNVKEKRVLLYQLEKLQGKWKISTW